MRHALTLLMGFLCLALAVNPITVKGTKFFDSVTGDQFYVVGVDYQPSSDPIADIAGLQRDIPLLKDLGVNAIRIYTLNVQSDQSQGMQLLEQNGIYVIFDLSSSWASINPQNPQWNTDLFAAYRQKIDLFRSHANTLGFLAGNEVMNGYSDTVAAAFVKASVRDCKTYIKSTGRAIPVGYAATDIDANPNIMNYLDCKDVESSVDFYGLNTYRWCGNSNFDQSGYSAFVAQWKNYDAPVIFTEYGCNQPSPRVFTEVQAIYGDQMTDVLSGGFVYEYSQEANGFGLVKIDGTTATKLTDYNNLQTQLKSINPKKVQMNSYNPTPNAVVACPPVSSAFLSSGASLPPTPDDAQCSCVYNALECVTATTDPNLISSTIGYICSVMSCQDISTNSTTATYGSFSGCSDIQKSSYILNAYYQIYKSQGSSACSFNGAGKIVQPSRQCTGPAPTTQLPSTFTPSTVSTQAAPTTSPSACTDMYASLTCRTYSEDPNKVGVAKITDAINYVCGLKPSYCSAITNGQYANCNAAERVSWAIDQYYHDNVAQGASACDFGGIGSLAATSTTSTVQNGGTTSANPTSSGGISSETTATLSVTPTSSRGSTAVTEAITSSAGQDDTGTFTVSNTQERGQTTSSATRCLPAVFFVFAVALL
ncbi:hypothetical protein PROFUN_07037 [Planoprotostelium fungivorum]|uniref:X8 domain-containing protein n=1 Tax=Planoprotostelium fungivorum TaxID=1890364 RepID=A0A2P6NMS3_9EUKA|nr:hypothetical protein PROFUN_07037 [Planoprotostelium fungivorum]